MANRLNLWLVMLTVKVGEFGAIYAWQFAGSTLARHSLVFWLCLITALRCIAAFYPPEPMQVRDDARCSVHTGLCLVTWLGLLALDQPWLAAAYLFGLVLFVQHRQQCIDVTPKRGVFHA